MKKLSTLALTLALIPLINFSVASANTVVTLQNGDKISGKLIEKTDATLSMRTVYAKKIEISWSQIKLMTLSKKRLIHFNDGKTITTTLTTNPDQSLSLSNPAKSTKQYRLAHIKTIPAINKTKITETNKYKISGHAKLAMNKSEGNTDTASHSIDFEFIVQNKKNRHTLSIISNKTTENNSDTLDNTKVKFQYDRFWTKKNYAYAQASAYEDPFKDLKLQTSLGLGLGYQFWDQARKKLSTEIGINYVDEDHTVQANRNYSALRWGVKVEKIVGRYNFKLFHKHDGLFDFDNTKNITLTSQTGISIPINKKLETNFQVNVDWDGEPSAGKESTDTLYLFGVGYRW